jgi:hypothetical protein
VYNVEPEACGSVVGDAGGISIPSVVQHVCRDVGRIPELRVPDPSVDGRWPLVFSVAQDLGRHVVPGGVAVPLSGPFSFAGGLVGLDTLLMASVMEPDAVQRALTWCVTVQNRVCREAAARGLAVIVFESSATPPLISPATFREVVAGPLSDLIHEAVRVTGKPVSLILGGNTAPIASEIFATGAACVLCPAETDQGAFMAIAAEFPGITVRVNMNPGVFASADLEEATQEAVKAMQVARTRENTCVGSGVLPYDARVGTVRHVQDFVRRY